MTASSRSVRISGGRWRGRRVKTSRGARPTTERVREAVFSRWGAAVSGATFLDLFCGGGGVGLEAASRGADSWFVDNDREGLAVLRANCGELGVPLRLAAVDLGLLASAGVLKQALGRGEFDLIYADPPYDLADYRHLGAVLETLLAGSGEAAVEVAVRRDAEATTALTRIVARDSEKTPAEKTTARRLVLSDRRRYGDSAVLFLRWSNGDDPPLARDAAREE